MGNKKNKNRRTRRSFHGNQHPKTPEALKRPLCLGPSNQRSETEMEKLNTASSKILKLDYQLDRETHDDFFLFMHTSVLFHLLAVVGICPDCHSDKLILSRDETKKMGLALSFIILCNSCKWEHNFETSPSVEHCYTPGPKGYSVNTQAVLAFREIGKGYDAIKSFCTCMGMPQPFMPKVFMSIVDKLKTAYESIASKSMKCGAAETRGIPIDQGMIDSQIAIDGTWQKRGHSSLHGVVVAMSKEGKVIDCEVMSKHCKQCQIWSKKEGTAEYLKWKAEHICKINHTKSSGAMEADGAIAIFQRSVDKYNLRYTQYLGDGDTGSYSKVCDARPYDAIIPKKLECLGHVQKRLGTRLRELCRSYKGKKLSDGKKLIGKGRLTNKAINTLQNYYGMAIRQNSSGIYGMKKGVGAVLYHCSDIENEHERHKFCPRDEDSWCKWWSDKIKYKKKLNLPSAVTKLLDPVFRDLSRDDLLERCIHGQTQNANEAFNHILWQKCPKEVFVGRDTLEISLYSAIINFNDGFSGIKDVLRTLGLNVSKYVDNGVTQKDQQRITHSKRKSSEEGKRRRKKLRALKRGYIDKEMEDEGGKSYLSGSF